MMIRAICEVAPGGKPCSGGAEATVPVTGVVNFEQNEGGPTLISYRVTGLAPGPHGFHV